MKQQILLLTLTVLCAVAPIFAQGNSSMPSFAPEIKRVAVFKNGYAFTYREGTARTANGWVYTNNVPSGVMGTVWGYTTALNTRVMQLHVSESKPNETQRVTDIVEVLLANEGARIRFVDNDRKIYEGTYEIISRHRDFAAPSANTDAVADKYKANKVTIALKTESGTAFFPVESVRNVEILGQPILIKPKQNKETRLAVKVEGEGDGNNINLGVAALERGIRWIPAYRIEVKGEPVKEAKVELEAVLINELADLKESEVYFVVGVPSFLFQETISPLSLNATFAGVSSYFQPVAASGGGRNAYSNAIMTQQSRYSEIGSGGDGSTVDATSSAEEQSATLSAEQLFLYQAKQVNLKKGERMSQRLFSLTVPCDEVFEWKISDPPNVERSYSSYNQQILSQDLSTRIWYALRLKNQTKMPWTTAPAISFREWKPLGQDLLSFTPVGGENILRVTPATEVIGSHKLEEKERLPNKLRIYGTDYDLITVAGTIKVRNIKKQPIEVVLTRNIVGEVLTTTDNGAVTREGLNLQAVNPQSNIKWNLTVPPGEKEIRYTYKVYVSR